MRPWLMAFNQEHMLLQWGGSFQNAVSGPVMDQFVGSMRFVGPGIDVADTDDTALDLVVAMASIWRDPRMQIPSMAHLWWVKWNRIGTDGKYVSRTDTRRQGVVEPCPGPTTSRYPHQIAWAATWTTDLQRGRASKGRTYWPTAVTVTANESCRVAPAVRNTMATACVDGLRTLITAVQSRGGTMVPAVMSNIGEGTSAVIKGVRVGDRLDIQRKRDNKVAEVYSLAEV